MPEASATAQEVATAAGPTPEPGERPTAAEIPVADPAVAAAERIAFLALASELARGRNVLVVDDGASALSGIAAHLDSTPLGEVSGAAEGTYDLVVVDLVVAGPEALESVSQLASTLKPQSGIALLRAPKRPEFAPLVERLKADFARSLSLRQHNWVSSALFDDAMFANDDPSRAVAASVRKLAAATVGEELFEVIVAAHGAFPEFRPQVAMTRSPELKAALVELAQERERSAAAAAEAQAREADQDARIRELEEELAWYDEHELAIRQRVEESSLAQKLLAIWVAFATNAERIRRVLRG